MFELIRRKETVSFGVGGAVKYWDKTKDSHHCKPEPDQSQCRLGEHPRSPLAAENPGDFRQVL